MRADRGLDPAQDRDADGLHEQRAAAYPVDLVGPVAVPCLKVEGPRGLVAGLIQGLEPARKLVAVEEEPVGVVHEELRHLLDGGVVSRVAPGCGGVGLLEILEVGADPVEVTARGAGGHDLLRRNFQLLLEGGPLGRDDHHVELVLLEDLLVPLTRLCGQLLDGPQYLIEGGCLHARRQPHQPAPEVRDHGPVVVALGTYPDLATEKGAGDHDRRRGSEVQGCVVHPPRRVEHPFSKRLGHHQRVERPDARQLHLERHRLRPGLLLFRTICGRLLDQREELLRCVTGIEPVGKVSSLLEARQLYDLHAACHAEKVARDRIGVLVARSVVVRYDHDVGARVVGAKLWPPRRRRAARRRHDAQPPARCLYVLRPLEVIYGLPSPDAVDKLGQPVENLGDVVEHVPVRHPPVLPYLPVILALVALDVEDLSRRRGELPVRAVGQFIGGQDLVLLVTRTSRLLSRARRTVALALHEKVGHAKVEDFQDIFYLTVGMAYQKGATVVALLDRERIVGVAVMRWATGSVFVFTNLVVLQPVEDFLDR
jgi:hypothetical protein